jgi:tRNA(Arg) A34 adenosine deaminase TadA
MNNEFFMKEALKEAQKAYDENEVPIGAVAGVQLGSNLNTLQFSSLHLLN